MRTRFSGRNSTRRSATSDEIESELDALLAGDEGASMPARGYSQIRRKHNSRPDFNNPNWADEVDDWGEFWGAAAYWDERELEDLDALDDEHDASLMLAMRAAADGDEDAAFAVGLARREKRTDAARLSRARQLISALRDAGKAASAQLILGAALDRHTPYTETPAEDAEPDVITIEDPNPNVPDLYLRAMVEKQQRKDALDAGERPLQGGF
ncbi:hypothetical protein MNEG_15819 [Monoraphidium neglectum]|uniref:Uncharacterized protein n=1 Tax=Monoraphidium neglectum TaxID=145388 RepID=A0A0D2LJK2_9CHLO|nr:hypothetical protein MNEG_15819 [Monoraphidium neglectum]KIY92144.1 hypothetical protein MNEG_15819 [Monoraphidium neglectum]|eukprot:XP_013891164.1 hypothetical protein MNEG_15819 [Monoraphidium neglectum]